MRCRLRFAVLVPLSEARLGSRHARVGDRHARGARLRHAALGRRVLPAAALRASKIRLRAIECRLCFRHGGFKRRSVLAAARETRLEPA